MHADGRRLSRNAGGQGPCAVELVVEAECHGIRIDSFLIRHFRNYSPWRMQRMVVAGLVTIDRAPIEPTRRVFTGETIRLTLVEPPDKLLDAQPIPFRLVYEDPWLLVVDKPAGVISHPTGDYQSDTLANGLQAYLDTRSLGRGMIRPGIVHRLDRHTSGLMVVATQHRAHAALSNAFESGRVSKTYLAIVEDVMSDDEGCISAPIGRARTGSHVLMSARGDALHARPARTSYRVLERWAQHTLVEASPHTGRNHQIRVHFAHLGHPLIGDEFYDRHGQFKVAGAGRSDATRTTRQVDIAPELHTALGASRHALHAASLAFAHPVSGAWLRFNSPLPRDLERLRQRLGATLPKAEIATSPGVS